MFINGVLLPNGLKIISLNELFSKLHSALLAVSDVLNGTIKLDNTVDKEEINNLRDNIIEKLGKGEDVAENKTILKVLNLFITDKQTLNLIKTDMDEWLSFLDEIERHLESKNGNATEEEIKEIANLQELTSEIKKLIRK